MRAVIKNIVTLDNHESLKHYRIENNRNFSVWIRLLVGPKDSEGEESFDIRVCTPQWLIANLQDDDILFGMHKLIVLEYNYERIVQKLTKYVERWNEPTWQDLAEKISRIGSWEFEDYKEYEKKKSTSA